MKYSERVTKTRGAIKGGELITQIIAMWALVLALALDGEVHPMGEVCGIVGFWTGLTLIQAAYILWRGVTGR